MSTTIAMYSGPILRLTSKATRMRWEWEHCFILRYIYKLRISLRYSCFELLILICCTYNHCNMSWSAEDKMEDSPTVYSKREGILALVHLSLCFCLLLSWVLSFAWGRPCGGTPPQTEVCTSLCTHARMCVRACVCACTTCNHCWAVCWDSK